MKRLNEALAAIRDQLEAKKPQYKMGQSPKHKWKGTSPVDTCERCGAHFSYNGFDTHGPIYCVPTPAWLKAHPEDDRKER